MKPFHKFHVSFLLYPFIYGRMPWIGTKPLFGPMPTYLTDPGETNYSIWSPKTLFISRKWVSKYCLQLVVHFVLVRVCFEGSLSPLNRYNSVKKWSSHRGFWTHNDVIKWKHISRYWHFVCGESTLIFSLTCAKTNGSVNNRGADDLRSQRAHYDVTVLTIIIINYTWWRHQMETFSA